MDTGLRTELSLIRDSDASPCTPFGDVSATGHDRFLAVSICVHPWLISFPLHRRGLNMGSEAVCRLMRLS